MTHCSHVFFELVFHVFFASGFYFQVFLKPAGVEDIPRLKLVQNAKFTSPTPHEAFLHAMYSVAVSKETKKIVAQSTSNTVLIDESMDVSNVAHMVVHLPCVSSGQVTV